MKKLICLLGILLMLTLLVPANQAEAYRGHGHGWILPGLIVGGIIGWSMAPRYYYPPSYYYPPPSYYYPPPAYYYPPPANSYPPPAYNYPPQGEAKQAPPQGGQITGGQTTGAQIFIYPRQNQTDQQLVTDRNECHNWAMDKTGYDPTKPPPADMPATEINQKSSDYHRALGACLEGRGYSMR
jgi:hypothetical protein